MGLVETPPPSPRPLVPPPRTPTTPTPHPMINRSAAALLRCRAYSTASASDAPHAWLPHQVGRCSNVSSGSSTRRRVTPGAPRCLPRRRPARPSSTPLCRRFGLSSPSDEGGFDEFVEFNPNLRRSSATSASSSAIRWPATQPAQPAPHRKEPAAGLTQLMIMPHPPRPGTSGTPNRSTSS